MPPKVYVTNYPAGDFRAMPAIGGGHALLKWVTSFPGNPARGLPTVTGLVLLSDADDGRLLAVLDAAAVTALRTAAAAVLAADTLCRPGASSYAVVGCGVNGAETVRMLVAHEVTPLVWDVDEGRRQWVAERLGARVAASAAEALSAEVVVTVTPGYEALYAPGLARSPGSTSRSWARTGRARPRSRSRSSAGRISSATTGSRRATAASWRRQSRRASSRGRTSRELGRRARGGGGRPARAPGTSRSSTRRASRSRTSRSRRPHTRRRASWT